MTPRQIRRAAEYKTRKLARKAELLNEPTAVSKTELSEAQLSESHLQPNRANAQLSTGPKSEKGKAITCLNAVKTALTGRTVLLPTDSAAEYERHIVEFAKELKPVGPRESSLVQSIADTEWRLQRIATLEFALFARGHVKFSNSFEDVTPSQRTGIVELETYLASEKHLRNLQLQESRLHRRRKADLAELHQLQTERRAAAEAKAAEPVAEATASPQLSPHKNGFEFSTLGIDRHLDSYPALIPDSHPEPFDLLTEARAA